MTLKKNNNNWLVDVEKIKRVSCKIKVDAVNWLCLKFDDKVVSILSTNVNSYYKEWHREENLKEKLASINAVLPLEFDPIVEAERKKQG